MLHKIKVQRRTIQLGKSAEFTFNKHASWFQEIRAAQQHVLMSTLRQMLFKWRQSNRILTFSRENVSGA